jgi:hypothetical protein
VTNQSWRPLGVDTDEQAAGYDALHDGLPKWMATPYWAWVRTALTIRIPYGSPSVGRSAIGAYRGQQQHVDGLDVALNEQMGQTLRIAVPDLRVSSVDLVTGHNQLDRAISALERHDAPLQIADYLLAYGGHAKADELDGILTRSKSAFKVGVRADRPGLVRRVPIGVQVVADSVMARAGRAGVRLTEAWEALYGLTPNASAAYRLAIVAVEDAAVPVVSPRNTRASLGTVLKQMEDQGDWDLPMLREHPAAPSRLVVIGMLRMLWHGQHDRHGGQPSAPGNVSTKEAQIAVSLAAALVAWFDAGLIRRNAPTPP